MTFEALLKHVYETFRPDTSSGEIERVLRLTTAFDPSDRACIISLMAQRLKLRERQLTGIYRRVSGAYAEEYKIDWTVDDRGQRVMTMRGSPILSSPNSEVLDLLWQYPDLLIEIHEILNPEDDL
jgi:hypothetical protein